MNCKTSYDKLGLHLCPSMQALLHASAIVGSEGLLIYDRAQKRFIETEIYSQAIRGELAGRDLGEVIEELNSFRILDINQANVWSHAENPYDGQLSLNVCLDPQRSFYINLQVTPINLGETGVRFLLCSLHFAVKRELNIMFFDRVGGSVWRYELTPKTFVQEKRHLPQGRALEILRLARMGYSERRCAELLHLSPETIKSYRKTIYRCLDVTSIEEAISYCELHHLI